MAIEKKSLIGNRATVKKAVLASNPTRSEKITSSPAVSAKLQPMRAHGKFARIDYNGKFAKIDYNGKFKQ